jgi:hypothetical protein
MVADDSLGLCHLEHNRITSRAVKGRELRSASWQCFDSTRERSIRVRFGTACKALEQQPTNPPAARGADRRIANEQTLSRVGRGDQHSRSGRSTIRRRSISSAMASCDLSVWDQKDEMISRIDA